jgi:class 3 adenylate cyclase
VPVLPAALVDVLVKVNGGALTLQLDAALQHLCWERTEVEGRMLGQHFALARQTLASAGVQRTGRRRNAHGPVGLQRWPAAVGGLDTHLPQKPGLHLPYDAADVLVVSPADPTILPPALPEAGGPGLAGVAILQANGNDAAQVATWLSYASALVVHDQAEAAWPAWQEALLDHLEGGCSTAEAVRRLRCTEPALAAMRVYGDAQLRLREPAAPSDAQQRLVSTLAADIVGSTRLIETWGHERYSQALSGFYALCAGIAAAHGGSTEEAQGDDCVISYFGHPRAIEQAASAAVRAGMELVERVGELGIRIRVAVASGQVAIEHGRPVGVSIHQAARLQKMAQPGSVVISGATRLLVGQRFLLKPLGSSHRLRGLKGEHEVWQVEGRHDDDAAEGPAAWTSRELPILGRDAELQVLRA